MFLKLKCHHTATGDGYTLAGGELRDGDGDIIATRAAAK